MFIDDIITLWNNKFNNKSDMTVYSASLKQDLRNSVTYFSLK
jgi:hypothetical protein